MRSLSYIGAEKITFPPKPDIQRNRHTYRRTDIIVYRVASLLKKRILTHNSKEFLTNWTGQKIRGDDSLFLWVILLIILALLILRSQKMLGFAAVRCLHVTLLMTTLVHSLLFSKRNYANSCFGKCCPCSWTKRQLFCSFLQCPRFLVAQLLNRRVKSILLSKHDFFQGCGSGSSKFGQCRSGSGSLTIKIKSPNFSKHISLISKSKILLIFKSEPKP